MITNSVIVFKHTRTGFLERQELVELEVAGIGDGHVSHFRGEGRREMYSPLHRKVPLPSPFSHLPLLSWPVPVQRRIRIWPGKLISLLISRMPSPIRIPQVRAREHAQI